MITYIFKNTEIFLQYLKSLWQKSIYILKRMRDFVALLLQYLSDSLITRNKEDISMWKYIFYQSYMKPSNTYISPNHNNDIILRCRNSIK